MDSLGYIGIFTLIALETVIPPIPSEVILPLAGFQVAQGDFSYPLVVLAATAGSLTGAIILYALGYWFGPIRLRWFVDRVGRYVLVSVSDLDRAQEWFNQHGTKAVFLARLVPGLRSLISLPAGVAQMGLLRFSLFTALGSAVWNALLVGLGWILGDRWDVIGDYMNYVELFVLGCIFAVIVWFFRRRILTRRASS